MLNDKLASHAADASGIVFVGAAWLGYIPGILNVIVGLLAAAWYVTQLYHAHKKSRKE